MVYCKLFTNWDDVQEKFGFSMKEPDEVLVAAYEYFDYNGNAWVVYRNGNKYYEVSGGHCSCNDLGGQWDPEDYDLETFIKVLEKRKGYSYGIDNVLEQLKNR